MCSKLNLGKDQFQNSIGLHAVEEELLPSWGGQAGELPLSALAGL